jgi:hypothetical protein
VLLNASHWGRQTNAHPFAHLLLLLPLLLMLLLLCL